MPSTSNKQFTELKFGLVELVGKDTTDGICFVLDQTQRFIETVQSEHQGRKQWRETALRGQLSNGELTGWFSENFPWVEIESKGWCVLRYPLSPC